MTDHHVSLRSTPRIVHWPCIARATSWFAVGAVAVCGLMLTNAAGDEINFVAPPDNSAQTSRATVAPRTHNIEFFSGSGPRTTLLVPPATANSDHAAADKVTFQPARDAAATNLADLKQRKQDSLDELQQRAAALVRTWNARKAKEALAALRAHRAASEQANAEVERTKPPQPEAGIPTVQQDVAPQRNPHGPQSPALPETSLMDPPAQRTPALEFPTIAPPLNQTPNAATAPAVVDNPLPANLLPADELPADELPAEGLPADEPRAGTPPTDQTPTPTTAADRKPEKLLPDGLPAVSAAVDGPIDRMALATSLFATGALRECLQTLEAVDRTQLSTENQDWCDYLGACCLRKLNNLPEAERRYRQLVAHSEVRWLSDAARWWLDHLNEQQKLRNDLEQLDFTLQDWQGEIHALRDSN